MRKELCLGLLGLLVTSAASAQAPNNYALAYNLQFVPTYEYVNAMSLNQDAREYYTVFILVYQNKGNVKLPVNDEYEVVTGKGEKHSAGMRPFVKKHVQDKRKFEAPMGKIGSVDPGATKYNVAIFDQISDQTPSFKLIIRGLPDFSGQENKYQLITEFQHLPQTLVRDANNAKDPTIIWEKDPDPAQKHRYIARWRQISPLRLHAVEAKP